MSCCVVLQTRMLLISLCVWSGAGAAQRRDYEPYIFAAVPLHAPVPVLRVLSPAPLTVPAPAARLARPPRPYASPVQHTPFTRPYAEPRPYADHGVYAESRPYSDVRTFTDSRPYVESRPYGESRPYVESRPYAESRPYTESRPYGEPRPYSDVRAYAEPRPYGNSRPYVEAVEYYDESGPAAYGRAAPQRPVAAPSEYAAEWDGYALPARGGAGSREEPGASQEASVLYARPSGSGGYTYRKVSGKQPPKKVLSSKEQPVVVKIHKHKIIKS